MQGHQSSDMYGNGSINATSYYGNGGAANGNPNGHTTNPMNQYYQPQSSNRQQQQQSPQQSSSSFAQRMKKFDYQNNIPSEFRVYTTHGALLSFGTILLFMYLISTEYTFNLNRTTKEKVYVNTIHKHNNNNQNKDISNLLEMEIDITFPDIPCALLSIDAYDPNNQRQSLHLDNKHRVWKHRIGKNGKMIGRKSKFELGMTLQHEDHIEEYAKQKDMKFIQNNAKDDNKKKLNDDDYYYDDEKGLNSNEAQEENADDEDACGSCYGAGEPDECCNTCDDVKRAYQRRGWIFEPNMDVKQCHHAKNSNEQIGEGCNVHGVVALSTGGGNLHITPGHELENFGKTFAFKDLAELISQAFETFNVTHTIKKLRFGREYPGDIHQLDGAERKADDVHGMYQYYFQIVPTEYRFLNGRYLQMILDYVYFC